VVFSGEALYAGWEMGTVEAALASGWETLSRCRELAPSVTAGAHTAFPELRADRPYRQPGDDSRP
jgi:hypothetical protein